LPGAGLDKGLETKWITPKQPKWLGRGEGGYCPALSRKVIKTAESTKVFSRAVDYCLWRAMAINIAGTGKAA